METARVVAEDPGSAEKGQKIMAGGLRYESQADMPEGMRRLVAAQRVAPQVVAGHFLAASPVAGRDHSGSKYHNEKVTVNGVAFDSRKESRRYLALLDAVRIGAITDLRLQQDFTLQEAYTTPEGERIRAIRYKADFTYKVVRAGYDLITAVSPDDLNYWRTIAEKYGHGALVVEDVKSNGTRTDKYKMKYKMMADRGYIIREV